MQEILVQWLGETGASVARYVIALVLVLLLLLILRWVLQRYTSGSGLGLGRNRQQRLAVMDAAVVDARRRLVLVRRDNVEHLLLIGGPTDIVVEQTIIRRMPVGTAGWMPQRTAEPATPDPRPSEAPAVTEQPAQPKPVARPDVRTETLIESRPPVRVAEPSPAPAEPMRATLEPMRATVEPIRPAERPAQPVRPVVQPVAEIIPYVPPAPSRPEPHVEAIAPIVPAAQPVLAAVTAPVVAEVQAPPTEDFDDLARRLDEALRIDVSEPAEVPPPKPTPTFARTSRGPARSIELVEPTVAPAPEPVISAVETPTVTAEPAAKPAPAVMSNTWFRPRPTKPAEAPRPAPQVVAPPIEQPVESPAPLAANDAELSAALAEDLSKIVLKPAPHVEIAPVPVAAPAPAVVLAKDLAAPQRTSEFSSLEDEMARLLDELSGDKKGG